jgi:hypothetical protein
VGTLPNAKKVCTVLIGSGNGGLTIGESVSGMLEGVVEALREGLESRVETIRFVEIDLARAHEILVQVERLKVVLAQEINLSVRSTLSGAKGGIISMWHGLALALAAGAKTAAGSSADGQESINTLLRRVPTDSRQREGARHALRKLNSDIPVSELARTIKVEPSTRSRGTTRRPSRISYIRERDRVRVAAIDRTAVVAERDIRADFALVEDLMAETDNPDPQDADSLAKTLLSMLLPVDLRELLLDGESLVFEVDRDMARVHWEIMAQVARGDAAAHHIGLEIPVARQLRTTYSPAVRERAPFGRHRRVLIVGDPGDPKAGDNLPGARAEAERVAEIFHQRGYDVELLVGAPRGRRRAIGSGVRPATRFEVLRLLQSSRFDILHYAGHGGFDPEDPRRAGWVFKDGLLTADEMATVDEPPQLVVANACLSGLTSRATTAQGVGKEVGLLPSLADEFFRQGVRNYIGTAWEIDDNGAIEFVTTLYNEFLTAPTGSRGRNGTPLGTAVLRARQALYERRAVYGSLWLAYQHYGDPLLRSDEPRASLGRLRR